MSLITQGGHYEWIIENGGESYSLSHLASGTLTDAVYEKQSIGNVIPRQLNIKLWDVEIDTTDPLVLSAKAVNVDGSYDTSAKGTYFVDTIATSPYSEYSEIVAFDALLKTEVPFMKSGDWSNPTDKDIVQAIATDIGVNISEDTLTILTPGLTVNEIPSIGDNGTTEREMLSVVGCMRGGNWIINDNNELELVLLSGGSQVAKVVVVDSNGDYDSVAWGSLDNTYNVLTLNSSGVFQSTAFTSLADSTVVVYLDTAGEYQQDTWENIQALAPSPYPTLIIGNEVVTFDVAPTETIKRVEVWANGSTSFRSPSGLTETEWNELGGVILSANMPIMASQDLADSLYSTYHDTTYVPYTADNTYFAPDIPLGTPLTIKNDTVLLTNRTINIDTLGASDLSADATQAVVSYYPKLTPVEKKMGDDIKENYARISVNEESIVSEVKRATEEEGKLNTYISTVEETANAFTIWHTVQPGQSQSAATAEIQGEANAAVNAYDESVQTYMRYEGNTLELGETGSPFKAKLDNTKLAFTGKDGQDAAWISNNELYVNHMVVPGGSSGRWIQQVNASNHFQIRWESN